MNCLPEKIPKSPLQAWIPSHIPRPLTFQSWGWNRTHLLPFHLVLEVDDYFDVPASFFPGRAISSVIQQHVCGQETSTASQLELSYSGGYSGLLQSNTTRLGFTCPGVKHKNQVDWLPCHTSLLKREGHWKLLASYSVFSFLWYIPWQKCTIKWL